MTFNLLMKGDSKEVKGKVTQTKLLSSFIQSSRLNLHAFLTFAREVTLLILVNQTLLHTYIL